MPQVLSHSGLTSIALILLAGSQLPAATQGVATGVAGGPAEAVSSSRQGPPPPRTSFEGDWPNIHVEDAYTRDAARGALLGASRWLARPNCQTLFLEFKDERNLPLTREAP